MNEIDKMTNLLGWDRMQRYDRSLFVDPQGEFVEVDAVEALLEAHGRATAFPALWEECGYCGGGGMITHGDPSDAIECGDCNGTGRRWKYYTPDEWVKAMAECGHEVELDEWTAVWLHDHAYMDSGWYISVLHAAKAMTWEPNIIICIPGQPRPPKGWRPE